MTSILNTNASACNLSNRDCNLNHFLFILALFEKLYLHSGSFSSLLTILYLEWQGQKMCIILKTFIEKLSSIKNSQLNDFFYRGSVTGLGNWRRSGKIVAERAFLR